MQKEQKKKVFSKQKRRQELTTNSFFNVIFKWSQQLKFSFLKMLYNNYRNDNLTIWFQVLDLLTDFEMKQV